MTAVHFTRTTTSNHASPSIYRGRRSLGARMVIMASDNKSVHDWIYRYLEPYERKGYGFYQVETEADFSEYAGKADTVMAFVEDIFFGDRTMGRLDYIRKQYPKLQLVLFSVSKLPLCVAARYLFWSLGSYLSLRDSEKDIRESLETVFGKRQGLRGETTVPSYLRGSIDEYGHLSDIKPYLTHREVEILRCAAEEKSAKETAFSLMLSRKTVDNHLSNIYEKFGIRNKVGVLKLAVSKGILPVEELMTYTVQL